MNRQKLNTSIEDILDRIAKSIRTDIYHAEPLRVNRMRLRYFMELLQNQLHNEYASLFHRKK